MNTAEMSQFRFLHHELRTFDFRRVPVFQEFSDFRVSFETKADYFLEEDGSKSAPGVEGALSEVVLRVEIEWSDPDKRPFDLSMEIAGLFSRHPDMPGDVFDRFSRVHAPSLLFTQLRPLVIMLTREAGVDFRLPLLNIAETIRRQDEARAGEEE